MLKESQAVMNEDFQEDIKVMIVSALQDLQQNRNNDHTLTAGLGSLKGIIDSIYSQVNSTAGKVVEVERNMVKMVTQFNPKIPQLYAVDEIKKIIQFSQHAFNPLSVIKTLEGLSSGNNNLKATNQAQMNSLLNELGGLTNNLDKIMNDYAPGYIKSMVDEVNTGIQNTIKVAEQFEKCINDSFGVHVPRALNIDSLTQSLATVNQELSTVSSKEHGDQTNWKKVKIGLICILGLLKDAFSLAKDTMPLNISLGGSGGVAAGVDAEAEASASVISLGSITWGSVATIVSMIMNIINTCDAYIDLNAAQDKAA